MAYKMKGFSGFGNSPLKQKGDNLKRIMTENKAAMKKAGTWYAEGAGPKASSYTASSSPVSSGATQYPRRAGRSANRIGLSGKIISKIAAPLTVAATLYDMYKSGQKRSGGKAVKGQKSFMEDAKKKTKSIWNKKK